MSAYEDYRWVGALDLCRDTGEQPKTLWRNNTVRVITYVVLNPAWNKRLLDHSSHLAFRGHMEQKMYTFDRVLNITKSLTSDRFYFQMLIL